MSPRSIAPPTKSGIPAGTIGYPERLWRERFGHRVDGVHTRLILIRLLQCGQNDMIVSDADIHSSSPISNSMMKKIFDKFIRRGIEARLDSGQPGLRSE